jgi:hypothetical protein
MTRSIVFLSDFGYRNEWVGLCHTVMNRIAPESPVVDLSHGVPPLDVAAGALLLADSLPYMRADAVVLAVVDPSVGRDRDVAVETADGRLLVGPDNGLLAPSWRVAGGAARAVAISSSNVVLEPVSPSFHARDVLAPAAAHLASGMALEELGELFAPASLAGLDLPEPVVEPGKIQCEVVASTASGTSSSTCASRTWPRRGWTGSTRSRSRRTQARRWLSASRRTPTSTRASGG